LSEIAKHSIELAEAVASADLFPKILNYLKDNDPEVKLNSCNCIKKIARISQECLFYCAAWRP